MDLLEKAFYRIAESISPKDLDHILEDLLTKWESGHTDSISNLIALPILRDFTPVQIEKSLQKLIRQGTILSDGEFLTKTGSTELVITFTGRLGFVIGQGPDSNGNDWAFKIKHGKKTWSWTDGSGVLFKIFEETDVTNDSGKNYRLIAHNSHTDESWTYKDPIQTNSEAFWMASEAFKEWIPKGPKGSFAKSFKKTKEEG